MEGNADLCSFVVCEIHTVVGRSGENGVIQLGRKIRNFGEGALMNVSFGGDANF